jgi:hypothetical protein
MTKEDPLTMLSAWTSLRHAAAEIAARWRARTTRIRVPPLSAEWLRTHEIDANKHASGR